MISGLLEFVCLGDGGEQKGEGAWRLPLAAGSCSISIDRFFPTIINIK
jgi:hypothetical protein